MASEQLFNLNLVKEIEKYPCLYNYKLIAYSLKDVTDKAWSDVGKTVNLSVSECKERWKNLRSVFIRHKKQAMNGTATRKPYYLEDAMEFIQPFVKSLKSPAGNTSASFEVVYDDVIVKNEDTSSHLTVSRQSPELDPWGVVSPAASPLLNQPYPSKKRPSEDKADLQDYLRAKIRKVQEDADPQKDANTLFLFSLLPDMNEMSVQQVRAFKRRVLDLIDEVLASNASPTTTVKIEPVYQYM